MPNLKEVILDTPELSELIPDYPAIARWLNERPLIDNPDPQQPVPVPVNSIGELFGIVIDPSNLSIQQDMDAVIKLGDFLDAGKHLGEYTDLPFSGPAGLVVALLGNPIFGMSADTVSKLDAYLAREMDDPSYQSQIPGPARWEILSLEESPTAEDVQGALV